MEIPDRYNIATATVDRHAAERPDALALVAETETGSVSRYSFSDVRVARTGWRTHWPRRGSEPATASRSCCRRRRRRRSPTWRRTDPGMIAVPLFVLFGPDALEYRLADSGAVGI